MTQQISIRFKEVLEKHGFSLRRYAGNSIADIRRISRQLSGESQMSVDTIMSLLNYFPDVSAEWLLRGEGEMLKAEHTASFDINYGNQVHGDNNITGNSAPVTTASVPIATSAQRSTDGSGIPLLPIEAMAGALTDERSVMEYECDRYIIPSFRGADFLIPVRGTSMQPTYVSGDIVACRRVSTTDLFFQWGKVYVLDTTQGALIKRVKPGSDPSRITIVSDNRDYDPFELPTAAINGLAIVIGLLRID